MATKWQPNGNQLTHQFQYQYQSKTPPKPPRDVENVENRPHGLRSTYAHGCRCELCRKANSDYEKARNKRIAMEAMGGAEPRRVPVAEAAWRIRRLLEMGYTMNELGRVTGLSDTVLTGIHCRHLNNHGKPKRWVNRSTIDALDAVLAARGRDIADGVLVPAGPTLAIVRLLKDKLGKKAAARALGWDITKLNNFIYKPRRCVRAGTAREVAARANAMRDAVRREHREGTFIDRMAKAGYVVNPYSD